MGDRGEVRGLLISTVVILGLATQGCGHMSYPSPPPPLVPTIVGVVDRVGLVTIILADGRTVDAPENSDVRRMGGIPVAGDLSLASTNVPKFVDALRPIETGEQGCWEAWDNPIAWDMGDTILFSNGIELPKAPGFHAPEPTEVNGRLAWVETENQVRWTFCANSQGQIEWAQPPQ
jgi:hypothetical protein